MSVTYGAGGTTRGKTIEIVKHIREQYGLEAMAHFTCVGATVEELRATLDEMQSAGIDNVLALRGDPPAGQEDWRKTEGGLEYSRELVELIAADYPFAIGGACFPETHIHAVSPEDDLEHLAEKVAAGVDFLITQLFFDNALYFDFVRARARGRRQRADHPRHHADHAGGAGRAHGQALQGLDPRRAAPRAARSRRGPGGGAGLRRGLRHAAVCRSCARGRARHPLHHAQPLARHARDRERAEARQAVEAGGARTLGCVTEIPYTVRRSARARRVRVNVHAHHRVEVVLPTRAPERAAAAAVSELRPWIERRLSDAQEVLARIAERAGTVPYLGTPLELVPEPGRTRVHRRGERLLVPAGDARPALERFYRRAARAEIAPRLDRATRARGLALRGPEHPRQRTRWGSCSAGGHMSFNWRLLLAPERVLEYVVWHEVCHLQVLDHSPRFWALVERHWPSYREERAWLSRNGATLVL